MRHQKIKSAYEGLLSVALNEVYRLNLGDEEEIILQQVVYTKPVLDKVRHMCKKEFKIRFNDKGNLVVRKEREI